MMSKPMKTLELHYPTIQFLIINKIIQVYERYDGANKMQIEQHWVIPQTVPYSGQRNWKHQNLKNGKVRFRLNNNVKKEREDSRLNAIECLKTSFPFGENSNSREHDTPGWISQSKQSIPISDWRAEPLSFHL